MIHHSAFIHMDAHVDRQTCWIGAGSKIWQLASVTRGTRLGDDCVVWPLAMLDGPVFGDRCIICSGVAMGPGFRIQNDVFIGPNVTLCNDMWPSTSKDGWDYDAVKSNRRPSILIEDGASIGAGAVILPGVIIGRGSFVSAGAVVYKDLPSGMLWRRDDYISPTLPDNIAERRMRSIR